MSDNVDLSLDDIIKRNKKARGGKILAGKRGRGREKLGGRGSVGGRRGRAIIGTRGRGRSNLRRTVNPGSIRGLNVGRGRGGGRSGGRGGGRGGGTRGRRNNFRANHQLQNQTILNTWKQVASSRGRVQGRRQNIKTRFMGNNVRYFSGIRNRQPNRSVPTTPARRAPGFRFRQPGVLLMARKRVQKLRQALASRRANPVQGRIAVSRFGLITTSRLNAQRERALIQKKINRAQVARNGSTISSMRSIFQNSAGQLLQRLPTKSPTWDHPPTRRAPPRNEPWANAVRTVRNSNENVVKTNLNPEIQRRIMVLQQQGRRIRGEDMMELDSQSSEIRPPVLTSTISLSDRFRMFMN